MSKKLHLLMIGGWTDLFLKAINLGFDVSYLGSCKATGSFDITILTKCKFFYSANIQETGLCLLLAQKIHHQLPITTVISFTELGMETAAMLGAILKIDGLDLLSVLRTRYKDLMREILDNIPDLAIPWSRFSTLEDLNDFYDLNSPKIIIKPISGAASTGIIQIASKKELEKSYQKLDALLLDHYIVEKFIDSNALYSVDTVSINGAHYFLSLSLTKTVGYPYSLSDHTVVPAYNLAIAKRDLIAQCVRLFLDTIELVNGAAHTEVKIDKNGKPYIIESQTRVGGDRIWKMIELTTGYSQVDITLANFIKSVIPKNFPKAKSVSGFFCLLPPPGKVTKISDLSFLKTDKAVLEYSVNIYPDKLIQPIEDNTQRCGYIFLQSPNHEALFEKINNLSQKLFVEYDDRSVWQPSFEPFAK
jgi:hypothetical protein